MEKLLLSKSRKLYQQNTSMVWVSAETQLTCQLMRRFHQMTTNSGHESPAFWLFWRKSQMIWTSAVLECLLCPGGLELTLVFEGWPNITWSWLVKYNNWLSTELTWPIRTKKTWVLGKLLNPQGKPRPTVSWIRNTATRYSKVALGGVSEYPRNTRCSLSLECLSCSKLLLSLWLSF